jgi:site-specific DNA-methyltransferase (adenine-specific)
MGDSGSAARFFYCAKASKADRDEGCEGIEERMVTRYGSMGQGPTPQQTPSVPVPQRNVHPTVKPTALMRYLCRLVTPPGGIVLDPFTGSGSTGKAAKLEGFNFIGIEREAEYVAIAQARIDGAKMDAKPMDQPTLFD